MCSRKPKHSNEIFVRVDASRNIGTGHFFRTLALSDYMPDFNFQPHFIARSLPATCIEFIKLRNYQLTLIPKIKSFQDEIKYLKSLLNHKLSTLLLDISHEETISALKEFISYLFEAKTTFKLILIIDGLKRTALTNYSNLPADIVVTPYFGAKSISPNKEKGFLHLAGPEFMIFHKNYLKFSPDKRIINSIASKLLVTFGGSDPKNLTLEVLTAFKSFTGQKLNIKIIVGPGFEPHQIQQISDASKKLEHKCKIIYSPESLYELLLWCDIAISTTGLTKYEMAMTGTPSILFSIDEDHDNSTKDFLNVHNVINLGVAANFKGEKLISTIKSLLDDEKARKQMSHSGMQILDGYGAQRILTSLRESINDKY